MLGALCIHIGVLNAFDIILICLTGDCFINKLKLRDPFKSYEIVPSTTPVDFYSSINVMWIICSCFRRQMGKGLQKK